MIYQPPFTITPKAINLLAETAEALGRLSVLQGQGFSVSEKLEQGPQCAL